jgi:hypothetical protein
MIPELNRSITCNASADRHRELRAALHARNPVGWKPGLLLFEIAVMLSSLPIFSKLLTLSRIDLSLTEI